MKVVKSRQDNALKYDEDSDHSNHSSLDCITHKIFRGGGLKRSCPVDGGVINLTDTHADSGLITGDIQLRLRKRRAKFILFEVHSGGFHGTVFAEVLSLGPWISKDLLYNQYAYNDIGLGADFVYTGREALNFTWDVKFKSDLIILICVSFVDSIENMLSKRQMRRDRLTVLSPGPNHSQIVHKPHQTSESYVTQIQSR
ncbi:hypothetical protein RRG08_015857 [Elysia crispata]|uniref:Uncharacterized protein n=1 Tax=Elysia crispata TaxID=231223 RepID=A0AAE1CJU3_9GAST|nr:hypothetical protein RRG08_015857 [Elysia crispata]